MWRDFCIDREKKLPQCETLLFSHWKVNWRNLIRELLQELVSISETLNEGEGQLARANYKLAVVFQEKGMTLESDDYKARAIILRSKLRPEARNAPFEETEFRKLCLWMLW